MKNNQKLLGLILPSKGRFVDLLLTLIFTPLESSFPLKVHFFVCANYNNIQLKLLRTFFSNKATFINERNLKWSGVSGAYNYGFDEAIKKNATWVALWADDLLPENKFWLNALYQQISQEDFRFGIFSSDEGCHKKQFGWNIYAGYPCAHFFIAKINSLPGYLLNPKFRSHLADNEIAISRIKDGIQITLLNVRVIHQPTLNNTRKENTVAYKTGLKTIYELHPELQGRLDDAVFNTPDLNQNCRYIVDNKESLLFSDHLITHSMKDFKLLAPKHVLSYKYRLIKLIRHVVNELILDPFSFPRRVLVHFFNTYKKRV